MKRLVIAALLVACGVVAFVFWPKPKPAPIAVLNPSALEEIVVIVRYSGTVREQRVSTSADPWCEKNGAAPSREIEGSPGRLANVLIRVVTDAATPPPEEAAYLDQHRCSYTPRVLGLVKGQTLVVKNSDRTGHNVHSYVADETCFNVAQPSPGAIKKRPDQLCTDSGVLAMKCDVHPWMTAFVHVLPNAYFGVTDQEGVAIFSVPRGEWTLEAWHETLGTKTRNVVIGEGSEAEFEFP